MGGKKKKNVSIHFTYCTFKQVKYQDSVIIFHNRLLKFGFNNRFMQVQVSICSYHLTTVTSVNKDISHNTLQHMKHKI